MKFRLSLKWKILIPLILITILFILKYIFFNFPINEGKRVGTLSNITQKMRYGVISTWEGTIDDGTGERLSTTFYIRNSKLAEELYSYKGKEVVIYYEKYLSNFPHTALINAVSWSPKETEVVVANAKGGGPIEMDDGQTDKALSLLNKTLFCTLLGTIFSDRELYNQVKEHVRKNNLYLFNQFATCNE